MEEAVYIMGNKGAAPVWWNGSYADEVADQSCLLPITVMSFHINLSVIDHSEMASDINWFLRRFLALCAKALSVANYDLKFNCHLKKEFLVESLERLVKSTSSALSQNKWSIRHCPDRRSFIISLGELPKLDEN
ncbi:MAG: hypothetical protein U0M54_05430 [Bacteroidales bacterium]